MKVYVWKGKDAWELATGDTSEQAAESLGKYFTYSKFDSEDLELYDELEGETRSYHYGYIDPRNGNLTCPDPDQFLHVYGFQHPLIVEYEKELANEQE